MHVLSVQEWLVCSGNTLMNGNSDLKIPTRTFLPQNTPYLCGPLL